MVFLQRYAYGIGGVELGMWSDPAGRIQLQTGELSRFCRLLITVLRQGGVEMVSRPHF